MINRRGFLVGIAATVVATALPGVGARAAEAKPPEGLYCSECQPHFVDTYWHVNRPMLEPHGLYADIFLGDEQLLHCIEAGKGWVADLRLTRHLEDDLGPYWEYDPCPDCGAILREIIHGDFTIDIWDRQEVAGLQAIITSDTSAFETDAVDASREMIGPLRGWGL